MILLRLNLREKEGSRVPRTNGEFQRLKIMYDAPIFTIRVMWGILPACAIPPQLFPCAPPPTSARSSREHPGPLMVSSTLFAMWFSKMY